jgi:hypothetical protein
MSAWQLGAEPRDSSIGKVGTGSTEEANVKVYVDRITKWIPGDVLALYVAGVTILASRGEAGLDVGWLVVAAIATPGLVLLGAWSTGEVARRDFVKAGLGLMAFIVWSLTVPSSGWQHVTFIAADPGLVTVIAALAGLVFGLIAEGSVRRWVG